jgi:hypothetical protein
MSMCAWQTAFEIQSFLRENPLDAAIFLAPAIRVCGRPEMFVLAKIQAVIVREVCQNESMWCAFVVCPRSTVYRYTHAVKSVRRART